MIKSYRKETFLLCKMCSYFSWAPIPAESLITETLFMVRNWAMVTSE